MTRSKNTLLFIFTCCLVINGLDGSLVCSQEKAENEAAEAESFRQGFLVQIPLPLTTQRATQVKQTLTRIAGNANKSANPREFPVVVLRFDTIHGATGAGSEFHACSDVATLLTSQDLRHLKKIAYVPANARNTLQVEDELPSRLEGHAVLVALACEEILVDSSAGIGRAGIDEDRITPPIESTYKFISGSRSPLPEQVVLSMLDSTKSLFEVSTSPEKKEYVSREEYEALFEAGEIVGSEELTGLDGLPMFDAKQLDSFSINCHIVTSRQQVAARYGLSPFALAGDPSRGEAFQPVQFELPSFVDQHTVDWSIRAIDAEMTGDLSMIILNMDCDGGDLQACLQFALYLSGLDSEKVRTVAHVHGATHGPAALIALACDDLLMKPTSRIGGLYEPELTQEDFQLVQPTLEDLAKEREESWSLFAAMLNRKLEVDRYEKKGFPPRLMCKDEFQSLEDKEEWTRLAPQVMTDGLSGENAERWFVARALVNDFEQVKVFYDLSEEPKLLTPTKTDRMLDSLASFLASPMVSGWLLFGAMFLISTEVSSPGLSIPGFLGAVCLILFFWSQHFDGNAHWLEILMFVAGVIFILLEIFVIPGLGIFGIGGLLMVICSIVLASQTFIIPRNSEEFARLPVSLGMLAAAGGGFLVAAAVLRHALPNTPYFKKMMLKPAADDTELSDRESVVDWSELQGKKGVSITQLMPAGKARINGQLVDVITDGKVVEKGEPVIVVEAMGNRVVVAPERTS